MSKGVQMAVATLSVFAAVAWIVSSSEGTFQFFQNVEELVVAMRKDPELAKRTDLRVRGFVVPGTIQRDADAEKVWFSIEDKPTGGAMDAAASDAADESVVVAVATPASLVRRATDTPAAQLAAVYNGIDLPDLFADGADVVLQGGMEGDVFVARRVTAKCPSKYETEETPGAEGAAGYDSAAAPYAGSLALEATQAEPANIARD